MKCKFCSFKTASKSTMITHIKNNHRSRITTSSSCSDSWIEDAIVNSMSDFVSEDSTPTYEGGGGSFDGGGASGEY